MGEGQIDLKAYFAAFRQLCPGVPGVCPHRDNLWLQPRVPVLSREFWKAWPDVPADRFGISWRSPNTARHARRSKVAAGENQKGGGAGVSEGRNRAEPEVALQGRAWAMTAVSS